MWILLPGVLVWGLISAGCFGNSIELQQTQSLQNLNEELNKKTDVAELLTQGNAYRNSVLNAQLGADSYNGRLAKAYYRRALDLDPNNVEAMISMATLYVLGEPHVAHGWARKALAIEPANADAHFVIGMAYAAGDSCDKAMGKFRELEDKKNLPERNRSYFYLWWGHCFAELEREGDSIKMYEKAIELEEPIEAATFARDRVDSGTGTGGSGGSMFELSE